MPMVLLISEVIDEPVVEAANIEYRKKKSRYPNVGYDQIKQVAVGRPVLKRAQLVTLLPAAIINQLTVMSDLDFVYLKSNDNNIIDEKSQRWVFRGK